MHCSRRCKALTLVRFFWHRVFAVSGKFLPRVPRPKHLFVFVDVAKSFSDIFYHPVRYCNDLNDYDISLHLSR
ncbi:unnamed protein product [Soboliphyme baturini]|uniref:Secreted protein n=1 Tax=Soboliphyme baturini TaxID=241478 RepID=A0A183IZ33_9BILA|nr:unnamed protein product [Soboliphyme baturini]